MKIIKRGIMPQDTKRVRCSRCDTLLEVEKRECEFTSQLGVVHDGLPSFNINCPVCNVKIYFYWR